MKPRRNEEAQAHIRLSSHNNNNNNNKIKKEEEEAWESNFAWSLATQALIFHFYIISVL
jgi:hypothetical protein